MTRRSPSKTEHPLRGIRVLVTRPKEDVESLRVVLERLGAQVTCLPTIAIRPLTASPDVTGVLNRLDDFDWVAFTSRNAIRAVFDWLSANDREVPTAVKIAAIGPTSAEELRLRGVSPDCIPPEASARALAAALISTGVSGRAVLLPLGDLAGDEVQVALEGAGARVTAVRVYETVPVQAVDRHIQGAVASAEIDVVALASPSAFRSLLELCGATGRDPLRHTHLVAIGPTTAEAIRAAGYVVGAISRTQTMEGLVEAIVGLYPLEQK
jgi:uroporphyrinogen III methyltransferase/synthase